MKNLLLSTPQTGLMNTLRLVVFITLFSIVSAGVLAAQQQDTWQVKRLLHPTAAQRADEQHGHVFIYNGLRDQVVKQALDKNFDRIDAMMFVNTKTPKAKQNTTQSNEEENDAEDDDGCD